MSKRQYPLMSWGIPVHIVSGQNPTKPEMTRLYAEIVPASGGFFRRLLPWVGNWWFEVHETNGTSWEYQPYGSGGAYTLRGCVSKAIEAVEEATTHLSDEEV